MSGLAFTSNDVTFQGRRAFASLLKGGMRLPPLVEPQGTPGTTTWGYRIEAVTPAGEVPMSPEGTTATGAATLSVTDFNRLSWDPFLGATSYNVYRTSVEAGGTPPDVGLIGSTSVTTFDDTGLATSGPVPTRQFGISHLAIGRTTTVPNPFGVYNARVGNGFQMDPVFSGLTITSVVVHNDMPIFNYTVNGTPNVWYLVTVANTQQDTTLSFTSTPALLQNKFNHIFMTHLSFGGVFGVGQLVVVPTDDSAVPVMGSAILYLGHIQAGSQIRNVVTACRMFDEITRVVPESVEFLDDSAINIVALGPDANVTGGRTSNVLSTGRFGPGITDTIREVGLFANDGRDLVAWQLTTATPLTVGQRFRLRWRVAL